MAQIVAIAATPILTRLYDPHAFGSAAALIGLVTVLLALGTGRYELAIPMATSRKDASALLVLVGVLGLASAAILLGVVALGRRHIVDLLGAPELAGWLWAAPALLFLMAVTEGLRYWNTRHQRFGYIARHSITRSLATVLPQIQLGRMQIPSGMVGGHLCGATVSTVMMAVSSAVTDRGQLVSGISISRIKAVAREHVDLPRRMLSTSFLNAASVIALPLLLTVSLGPADAGLVMLAQRIVVLPVQLFGQAIWQVGHARLAPLSDRERADVLRALFGHSCTLYALPMVAIVLLRQLAVDLLGPEWSDLSPLLPPIAAMTFLNAVSNSVSYFAIWRRYRAESRWNMLLTSVRLLAVVGAAWSGRVLWVVVAYSVGSALVYGGILYYWALQLSGGRELMKRLVRALLVATAVLAPAWWLMWRSVSAAVATAALGGGVYYIVWIRSLRADDRLALGHAE